MALTYYIPKHTDKKLVAAMGRIRESLKPFFSAPIRVHIPHYPNGELNEDTPERSASLREFLALDAEIVTGVSLLTDMNRVVLNVKRVWEKPYDTATIPDDWAQQVSDNLRPKLAKFHAQLLSAARRELGALDLEASFSGNSDSEWNRYREAQMMVVNGLERATETILVKAAENNAKLDQDRAERFAKAEAELKEQLQRDRETLQKEFEQKAESLAARERELTNREAAFNTKEARYVARAKQEEQIEQVKNWLENWQLTRGTTQKRLPITVGYIAAIAATGALTIIATYHNYKILDSAADIAKLAWWHWVAITLKAFLPLAACSTFVIYFIRWTSAWARQHAEEEFRNRALLIDIGRSSWLLEAVRDAQERKSEIPADLLKELSRNLFSYSAATDGDIHPDAISDVLLQGLASLRVKVPGGTEVEATRGGK